jgi:uncharacterized membrane protein YhiD involved in acid resistance
MTADELVIAWRLVAAILAGVALGFRRRHKQEAAGYLTVLIGMLVSLYLYDGSETSTRVVAEWTARVSSLGWFWAAYANWRSLRRGSALNEDELVDKVHRS